MKLIVLWIVQCQHESGGFGGNIGHDPHVLYTLSAIQVLALFDKIDVLDIEKVANYIASLQNEDGSFSVDIWGEIDTRIKRMEESRTGPMMLLTSSTPISALLVRLGAIAQFVAICGLKAIDPAYALPVDVLNRILLSK